MYIGQDLQVAYPSYTVIDDISGSFNGVTTSFALTVNGSTPVPLPINSQQCLISVGGVVQRPDDTGAEGFRLSGSNIVFSSAPNTGEDFFGTILAGADYVNAGVTYPSGSAAAPSITFDSDPDTGIYNAAANQVGVTCAGSTVSVFSSSGQSFLAGSAGSPSIYASGDTNTGIFFPAADTIAFAEGGAEAARIDSSGRLLVGTSSANANGGVLQLSSGITFPATQVLSTDPNTLDDYEEGTWTVELYDASTGGNASSTTTTGTYTKIGRQVAARFALTNISTAGMTAANVLYFTLPFTSDAGSYTGTCDPDTLDFATGRTMLLSYVINSSRGYFLQSGDNISDTVTLVSYVTSGTTDLRANITYFV